MDIEHKSFRQVQSRGYLRNSLEDPIRDLKTMLSWESKRHVNLSIGVNNITSKGFGSFSNEQSAVTPEVK